MPDGEYADSQAQPNSYRSAALNGIADNNICDLFSWVCWSCSGVWAWGLGIGIAVAEMGIEHLDSWNSGPPNAVG